MERYIAKIFNKILLLILLGLTAFSKTSYSQIFNASNLPCQVSTGAVLDNMSGATTATLSDVSPTALIPFGSGFTFWFAGVNYTGISMCPDGWVKLGSAGSVQPTANFNSTTNYPIIAPYWCDMQHLTPLKYKMIGTSPNRTFIVSWVSDGLQLYSASFQLWLHETTGQIDFVYGTVYSNTAHYSIGMGDIVANQNTFVNLITDTLPQQTLISYNGIYNQNTLLIPSGTMYSFIPATGNVMPAQNFQFTNVSAGCLSFSWEDNSTNEAYYKVLRSTDNINFTFLKAIASTSTSTTGTVYQFSDTNLVPQTHYYYKVEDYNFCSTYVDYVAADTVTSMPSIQGVKAIPGDYPSIYEALQAIKCERLAGPVVLELQSNYYDSGEVFPLRLNQYLYTSLQNTLTIRPAPGATGLSISDSVGFLFDINNAQGITIDGRPGGTGNQRELTLENKSTNGIVVNFINDAKHEQLLNLRILGSTINTNSGSVVIGTSSQLSGNDSILIDSCLFTNASTGLTANHIYARGSSGKNNDHINVEDCLFSNSSTNSLNDSSASIQVLDANDNWVIKKNSFYNDSVIVANGVVYSILIKNTDGTDFFISENYFGGRSSNAQGAPMDLSAKSGAFISLATASACVVRIHGNVIRNITLYQTTINAAGYKGIWTVGGKIEIDSNLIGRTDTIDNIVIRSQSSQSFDGIVAGGNANLYIHHNVLSGIRINGIGNSSGSMTLISGTGGDSTKIISNQIGSAFSQKSIYTSTNGPIMGIACNGTVDNNVVCNFWKDSPITGVDNAIYGISGTGRIKNNRIWGFHTNAYSGNPVRGIKLYGSTGNSEVINNEIHSIEIEGVQTQYVYAIDYTANIVFPAPMIAGNFIHHIFFRNNTLSQVDGIYVSGQATVINNMIALGYCSDGSINGSTKRFLGIETSSGYFKVLFNSIYIGGVDSVFAAWSCGISLNYGSNTDSIFNNIVFIDRVKSSLVSSVGHAVIGTYSQSSYTPHINYNMYYVSDAQGNFTLNSITFSAWQNLGYDLNSIIAMPGYIYPSGDTQSVNLHIIGPSPVDAAGYNIPWVLMDIDSDSRAANTPVDIGADAGNFFITSVQNQSQLSLRLYPNPAQTELFIPVTEPATEAKIEIIDFAGKLLFSCSTGQLAQSGGAYSIDISLLDTGAYFVQLSNSQTTIGAVFIKE